MRTFKLILILILMLILSAWAIPYEKPPPEPACTTDWGIVWIIEECKHCDWTGTYVLWHCYDANNNDHYYNAQCYYGLGLPIIWR